MAQSQASTSSARTSDPRSRARRVAGSRPASSTSWGTSSARGSPRRSTPSSRRSSIRSPACSSAGWTRIRVVTDHGWLLLPGGLPQGRASAASRGDQVVALRHGEGRLDAERPDLPLVLEPARPHRVAAGHRRFAPNTEYAHGGVSLQECVIPELDRGARRGGATAAITEITWRGHALPGRGAHQRSVSCASICGSTGSRHASSIAARAKEVGPAGEASLAVADDKHEGAAAIGRRLRRRGTSTRSQADNRRRRLMSMELDDLDQLAASAFDGYIVRKDLVRKFARQYPVPTYVGEFLLGRYCASTDEEEIAGGPGDRRAAAARPHGPQPARRSCSRPAPGRRGSVKLIDIITARLDAKTDSYLAELPSLQLKDVRIDDELVRDNERMLTGGFYAEVDARATTPSIAQEKNGQPIRRSTSLRPIQLSKRDVLDALCRGPRGSSRPPSGSDFLLRSVGLEPAALTRARAATSLLLRMVPFVERNYNLVELGPARHRQEPPVPAGLALRAPDLRRQGDRRQHVRQQRERPARPGLPVRRRLLRRGVRRLLRPEGRRQHHEGLHGVRRVQPRQGEHPRRRQHRAWSATSTWTCEHQQRVGHLFGPLPPEMRNDTAFMDRIHCLPARAGTCPKLNQRAASPTTSAWSATS